MVAVVAKASITQASPSHTHHSPRLTSKEPHNPINHPRSSIRHRPPHLVRKEPENVRDNIAMRAILVLSSPNTLAPVVRASKKKRGTKTYKVMPMVRAAVIEALVLSVVGAVISRPVVLVLAAVVPVPRAVRVFVRVQLLELRGLELPRLHLQPAGLQPPVAVAVAVVCVVSTNHTTSLLLLASRVQRLDLRRLKLAALVCVCGGGSADFLLARQVQGFDLRGLELAALMCVGGGGGAGGFCASCVEGFNLGRLELAGGEGEGRGGCCCGEEGEDELGLHFGFLGLWLWVFCLVRMVVYVA